MSLQLRDEKMAFIDKLKEELDKAGRAAQGALDEGKIRLEAFRTRQLADKAAQALGYAVFRARQGGGDVDADTYTRLSATLATHDSEAAKYEAQLEDIKKQNRNWGSTASTSTPPSATASAASDPAAAPEANAQDVAG
ncbi:MAG TPA: hypothetical protein VM053_10935 [Gemmatimonadaceae bacterium]|nr:hypothetical protein [Gemmatimonadaceae bacterium]